MSELNCSETTSLFSQVLPLIRCTSSVLSYPNTLMLLHSELDYSTKSFYAHSWLHKMDYGDIYSHFWCSVQNVLVGLHLGLIGTFLHGLTDDCTFHLADETPNQKMSDGIVNVIIIPSNFWKNLLPNPHSKTVLKKVVELAKSSLVWEIGCCDSWFIQSSLACKSHSTTVLSIDSICSIIERSPVIPTLAD